MKTEFLSRHLWFGDLTVENCEAVAREIERRLTGKYYVYVAENSALTHIHVRTMQHLTYDNDKKESLSTWREGFNSIAGFTFGDTYGIWYHSTSEHDADKQENLKTGVYIELDGDTIRINDWDKERTIRIVIKVECDISESEQ